MNKGVAGKSVADKTIEILGPNSIYCTAKVRKALFIPIASEEVGSFDPVLNAKLDAATTLEECESICRHQFTFGLFELKAIEKRNTFLRPQLDAATSMEECYAVYRKASGELKFNAAEKLISLATSVQVCLNFCSDPPDFWYHGPVDEITPKALWKAISLATCVDDFKRIFAKTEESSLQETHCIRAIAALLEKQATVESPEEKESLQ